MISFFRMGQALICGAAVLGALVAWEPLRAQGHASDRDSPAVRGIAEEMKASKSTLEEPRPDHHIFGVLPNYRTADGTKEFAPITPRQKFAIAVKDSFDWPLSLLGGAYAGLYQLENASPSFGQGVKGYAHRFGTSYSDQVMGNMLTEGIMPTLLQEDPRYFRRVHGSKRGRTGYALTRILVTRMDSGSWRFNFSEVLGNGIGASIANAYYPDSRGFSPTMARFATQLGTDAVSSVLKEFWPDIKQRLFHRHQTLPVLAMTRTH
jgi:hypothetical protein